MKTTSVLALGCALAATNALPASIYTSAPHAREPKISALDAQIDKLSVGGLSTPSSFSHTLNTKTAPVNYGNLNMGTGMMPSQITHYGTENQPDHGYISPILVSTTAKEVDYQVAKAEKVKNQINADVDIERLKAGKLQHLYHEQASPTYQVDLETDDPAKWGWGGGWGWGRRRWGWGG
ncbi:hypothetical protein BG005_006514, partial [Podila minutissima]